MQTETNRPVPMQEHGKKESRTDSIHLRDAAWNFAHTILWHDKRFSSDEVERAKHSIGVYLREAIDIRRAFTNFCERIILAHKIIIGRPDGFIPNPSVWFNSDREKSFADTKKWLDKVHDKRIEQPDYLKHIAIMSGHYYNYILRPSAKIFISCRKKLLKLSANRLLQQFYNTIVHFNYTR